MCLKENVQQVTCKLRDYSTCILQTEVGMNCIFDIQVSLLSAIKLAQTSTNETFSRQFPEHAN